MEDENWPIFRVSGPVSSGYSFQGSVQVRVHQLGRVKTSNLNASNGCKRMLCSPLSSLSTTRFSVLRTNSETKISAKYLRNFQTQSDL